MDRAQILSAFTVYPERRVRTRPEGRKGEDEGPASWSERERGRERGRERVRVREREGERERVKERERENLVGQRG